MKSFLAKGFSIVLNILITITVVILIILIYLYIQVKIQKSDYPNLFGFTAFKVASGSMQNAIQVDDIVVVKIENDINSLKKNDIIVFKQDESIVTHRIIEINENMITTKGDANNTEDEPITSSDVIGKVIKIVPNIAIWKKVLTSPEIIILILVTVNLWGISASFLGKKVNENEAKKDKSDV